MLTFQQPSNSQFEAKTLSCRNTSDLGIKCYLNQHLLSCFACPSMPRATRFFKSINFYIIIKTHCFLLPFVEKTGLRNAVEMIVTGLILNLGPIPSNETLFWSWKYFYHNFPDRSILPNALSEPGHTQKKSTCSMPRFYRFRSWTIWLWPSHTSILVFSFFSFNFPNYDV